MPAIYLLVFPEDFTAASAWRPDVPAYVRVIRQSATTAVVRSVGGSNPEGEILSSTVATRTATQGSTTNGLGEMLRKSVFCFPKGKYYYGQVTGVTGRTLTVRSGDEEVKVPASKVKEIALLLQHARVNPSEVTLATLRDHHVTILDRLMGLNGETATRKITDLLDGIVPSDRFPESTAVCGWVDPLTGSTVSFRLQHAVDFAFCVDGSHLVPRGVQVGSLFTSDPTMLPSRATRTSARQSNHREPHDPQLNASLDAFLADFGDEETVDTPREAPNVDEAAIQSEIVSRLSSEPRLLSSYLTLCASSSRKRRAENTTTDDHRPTQRRVEFAPSDWVPIQELSDRVRATTSFRPSAPQRAIHNEIVCSSHSGKPPSIFVELTVSSRATPFKPHPAILTRLFDFQFGVRGRSVAHFDRFDYRARREWSRKSWVNMGNLSAGLEIPCPVPITTIERLHQSLSLISVFAREFYNTSTCEVIDAALAFSIDLLTFGHWSASDADAITGWFDDVFEDYRRSIEDLLATGDDKRLSIKTRFSRSDPNFLMMLHMMQSERPPSTTADRNSSNPPTRDPQRADRHQGRRPPPEQRRSKVPSEVIAALPRQNGQSICLKYLSRQGCPSRTPDRCMFDGRVQS